MLEPRRVIESYLRSVIPTAIMVALSWLVSVPLLGNAYYLAVFLPVLMTGCLLLAWFGYLKQDRFTAPRQRAVSTPPPTDENDTRSPYARWDGPVLPRSDPGPDTGNRPLTLLWIAANLAITATILYHAFGVGASFFGAR